MRVEQNNSRSSVMSNHQNIGSFNIVDPKYKTQSRFSNSIEFILSYVGFAVGYGNIWRFPYIVFRNGGGIFFIPFTISILVIVFPVSYAETAFGQMYRHEVHKFYDFVNPRLLGLSFGINSIIFFISIYYT